MPRYNVEHNGKWACFSTIVDGFITKFVDKVDHEAWRREVYGELDCKPAEKCNVMTIGEAVHSAALNEHKKEVIKNLIQAGIDKSEAERLWKAYSERDDKPCLK